MTREELQQIINGHDREHGPPEKLSDRWRREANEAEAERKAERNSRLTDAEAAQLEARLVGMVAAERAYWSEVLPELIALLRREITAEISEAIGELRAETNVNRTIDKSENVTELPSFLRKSK
jgi:hypothetical protein